jgi:hypothetical protein
LVEVADGFVVVGFPPTHKIHIDTFEQPKNRDVVEVVMAEVLGQHLHLKCRPASKEELLRSRAESQAEPELESPAGAVAAPSRLDKARKIFDED